MLLYKIRHFVTTSSTEIRYKMDALPNADTRRGGKNPSWAGLTSCTSPEVNVSICEHLCWNVRHRVVTTKL